MTAKYEEPKVMQELHAIRARHYEETKHLTRTEYVRSVHEEAQKIAKKYGFKIAKNSPG
jgi:protein-disulfide isomerase-like protein with CxxC motif